MNRFTSELITNSVLLFQISAGVYGNIEQDIFGWLQQLKEKIRSAQIKAAVKVNAELLSLYWDLGKEIIKKEQFTAWGDKWLPKLSVDLLAEFPDMKGFSHTNLKYVRRWVDFYANVQIGQQVVARLETGAEGQQPVARIPGELLSIPWGHHLQIITR